MGDRRDAWASHGTGRRWFPISVVLLASSLAPLAAKAQDPGLVATMAANEVAAKGRDTHYSYIAEEVSSRTGGHLWREKVVETDDGPLHRLLAVDGKALSPTEAKAEEDRISRLISDPSAFRAENLAHKGDESHAAQLLGLLPKAFLITGAGEQNGCAQFNFRPNPAFQPSTYEQRVAHAMEGTVSLKQPENRLCVLTATIATPVEFGFGFLGRIEKGGHFSLERIPVDSVHWKSDRISVHIAGRILLLKSITRDQDVKRLDIHIIPQQLSLGQAAQLSAQ